jgi:hypothetical protein
MSQRKQIALVAVSLVVGQVLSVLMLLYGPNPVDLHTLLIVLGIGEPLCIIAALIGLRISNRMREEKARREAEEDRRQQ